MSRKIEEKPVQDKQSRMLERSHDKACQRFFQNVTDVVDRDHGEVNYYLTQFLGEYSYFNAYLARMGKVEHAMCHYHGSTEDGGCHTIFEYERWNDQRASLQELSGLNAGQYRAKNTDRKREDPERAEEKDPSNEDSESRCHMGPGWLLHLAKRDFLVASPTRR